MHAWYEGLVEITLYLIHAYICSLELRDTSAVVQYLYDWRILGVA